MRIINPCHKCMVKMCCVTKCDEYKETIKTYTSRVFKLTVSITLMTLTGAIIFTASKMFGSFSMFIIHPAGYIILNIITLLSHHKSFAIMDKDSEKHIKSFGNIAIFLVSPLLILVLPATLFLEDYYKHAMFERE